MARKVREEAGIAVTNVRCYSSQSCPFPASLMVGFTAEAETKALKPMVEELEDVRWVRRA